MAKSTLLSSSLSKNEIFKLNLILQDDYSVIIPKIYKTNLKECFIFY
ncbi:hypothetical protein ID0603_08950 [Helicobacter pylori]